MDSRQPNPTYTFTENGNYRPTLKVTDPTGRWASAEVILPVGTLAPVVTFVTPTEDQPFEFGDTVQFEVNVVDDAPVNCANVTVTYILGHDQHGHPLSTASGCTGSITTFLDARPRRPGQPDGGVRRLVHRLGQPAPDRHRTGGPHTDRLINTT